MGMEHPKYAARAGGVVKLGSHQVMAVLKVLMTSMLPASVGLGPPLQCVDLGRMYFIILLMNERIDPSDQFVLVATTKLLRMPVGQETVLRECARRGPCHYIDGGRGAGIGMLRLWFGILRSGVQDLVLPPKYYAISTAINLRWAIERDDASLKRGLPDLLREAQDRDRRSCRELCDGRCRRGGDQRLSLYTHCNTGSLATAGIALGVIRRFNKTNLCRNTTAVRVRVSRHGSCNKIRYQFKVEGGFFDGTWFD